MAAGVFYGIGVGPGDPELLTIKAYRVLQEAEVICAPRSREEKDGVALSIIQNLKAQGLLRAEQEVLELHFPMTREREELERCWKEAAERIVFLLRAGKKVAFLTLGDPAFYSSYTYVARKIRAAGSWRVETIPGVPSFCAGAALAEVSLAEGEEKVAILPGAEDLGFLRWVVQNFENVVLLKASRRHQEVLELLQEMGLAERAIFVSRCGLTGELVERLGEKKMLEKPDYLSLLIIKRN